MTMQHEVMVFGYCPFERDLLVGKLCRHFFEIFDEGFFSIRHFGIVLNVPCLHVHLNCLLWFTLIEHQIIKSHRI